MKDITEELEIVARSEDTGARWVGDIANRAKTEIERLRLWHPFETLPDRPMQVEMFYGNLVLTDQDGNVVSAVVEPYRDERRFIAYFDGEVFREMGTGHSIPDYGHEDVQEWRPTHWRELPPVPEEKHDRNQGPEGR